MNKFQFMGRLTKEPEVRYTTTNMQVTTFDIAVNRRYNNEQVKADFFKITSFGKTAEFCSKYFSKGQQVLIEGRIQNRTYEDQNGQKRYTTDYIAEQVYFAGESKKENNAQTNNVQENIAQNNDFISIDMDNEEIPFL